MEGGARLRFYRLVALLVAYLSASRVVDDFDSSHHRHGRVSSARVASTANSRSAKSSLYATACPLALPPLSQS